MLNELIANAPDARTRNAAASRLSKGVTLAPDVLTSESRQILAAIGQALEQEQRFDTRVGNGRGIPYVTYGLIIINVVAFLLEELNGGSTNNETIYRLGALWAPDVAAGQWDRLILPLFLHFGLLHLLFNMVALYVLGPYVEFALGLRRYLVVYFVSGIGASLLVYGLVQGLGMGLFFIPLSTVAFLTLAPRYRTDGTAMLTLVRNVASSAGISVVIANLSSKTTMFHSQLAEHINPFNDALMHPDVTRWLDLATDQGRALADQMITLQAVILAYANDFMLLTVICVLSIPFVIAIGSTASLRSRRVTVEVME